MHRERHCCPFHQFFHNLTVLRGATAALCLCNKRWGNAQGVIVLFSPHPFLWGCLHPCRATTEEGNPGAVTLPQLLVQAPCLGSPQTPKL